MSPAILVLLSPCVLLQTGQVNTGEAAMKVAKAFANRLGAQDLRMLTMEVYGQSQPPRQGNWSISFRSRAGVAYRIIVQRGTGRVLSFDRPRNGLAPSPGATKANDPAAKTALDGVLSRLPPDRELHPIGAVQSFQGLAMADYGVDFDRRPVYDTMGPRAIRLTLAMPSKTVIGYQDRRELPANLKPIVPKIGKGEAEAIATKCLAVPPVRHRTGAQANPAPQVPMKVEDISSTQIYFLPDGQPPILAWKVDATVSYVDPPGRQTISKTALPFTRRTVLINAVNGAMIPFPYSSM